MQNPLFDALQTGMFWPFENLTVNKGWEQMGGRFNALHKMLADCNRRDSNGLLIFARPEFAQQFIDGVTNAEPNINVSGIAEIVALAYNLKSPATFRDAWQSVLEKHKTHPLLVLSYFEPSSNRGKTPQP